MELLVLFSTDTSPIAVVFPGGTRISLITYHVSTGLNTGLAFQHSARTRNLPAHTKTPKSLSRLSKTIEISKAQQCPGQTLRDISDADRRKGTGDGRRLAQEDPAEPQPLAWGRGLRADTYGTLGVPVVEETGLVLLLKAKTRIDRAARMIAIMLV